NRENKVHYINDHQRQCERRQHPLAIDFGFEMFAVKGGRDREHCSLTDSHDPTVPEVLRFALDKKHSPRAHEHERAEDVENEIEPLHQLDPDPDHDSADDQRDDNTPDQSSMLRHSRNLEILKDDNENENVVDAQRVFDHVTGEKFEALLRTADFPDHEIEQ